LLYAARTFLPQLLGGDCLASFRAILTHSKACKIACYANQVLISISGYGIDSALRLNFTR
jgi:hypothetical protein